MKAVLFAALSLGALFCVGLVVSDITIDPRQGQTLQAEDVIDLGTIPPGRQVIKGQLTLTNDRDEPCLGQVKVADIGTPPQLLAQIAS